MTIMTLDDLEECQYLKMLVIAGPKMGKTWCTIRTCEKPCLVLNSDDKFAMTTAAKTLKKDEFFWTMMLGDDLQQTENALSEVRKLVKEKKIKTVIWDTVTMYADRSLRVFIKQSTTREGNTDPRKYYWNQRQHINNIINRLIALDCHVIVNSHYSPESSNTIDGQLDKVGDGILPGIEGKARYDIPRAFQNVVFLDMAKGERVLLTASEGVWKFGCRNLPGVSVVSADIGKLWRLMQKAPGEVKKEIAAAPEKVKAPVAATRPVLPARPMVKK